MLYKFVNNTVRAHGYEKITLVNNQYVSLENYINGRRCCLNTQLTHKSNYFNGINLVALNVLCCWATTEKYIFASF